MEPTEQSVPLVEGAPANCSRCAAALCVRKQVINLALGNTDQMQCLRCLSLENETTEAELLDRIRAYVLERDCFKKQWIRYESRAHCPDPQGCVVDLCFANIT